MVSELRPPVIVSDGCKILFAGEIPDFSQCVALKELYLYGNKLTGKSTTITSRRSELVCSGTIPDFSKNTALVILKLDNNELTGKSTTITSDRS